MPLAFGPLTPDEVLIRALHEHESADAFGPLYDRHTPRAFQTAWRILGGDRHEAEDAVQEGWIRALASLDACSAADAFGAWFRGIVTHVAIDIVRKNARFTDEVDAEWEAVATPSERLDLEPAIASLAPGYRAVLVLHDLEGYTHEEIAERLGITAGTSKGQLFKARRAVRARLGPEMEESI